VGVVEGGYDLDGLGDCLRAAIRALGSDGAPPALPRDVSAPRGDATIAAVGPHLAAHWTI
jgi:hypothetical protein